MIDISAARASLACSAVLASLLVVGGATAKEVRIYNWSDYIDEEILKDFEKETGIKTVYDVFDSNEMLEAKLLAGGSGYDVVVPTGPFLSRQVKAGVFQKLDKSKLPNTKNLWPLILERSARYDPDNAYSINYMWGTTGIGYNEDKIKQRMADAPVDSWELVFNPEVLSKFKDCGVTLLDAPSEVVGTVLIYLGRDANSEKPEDLKAAEDVLMKIRPYVRYVNSSRYIDDLANGEICLAMGWSGDVLQARDRAVEAAKGIEIKYNIPKEGAIAFYDNFAIPKDAKHVKNAYLFLDYMMRPEVAAKNSNYVNYASNNSAALPMIDDTVKNDVSIYPTAEVKAKIVPDLAESPEFTRLLTRAWTRFRTGK